MPALPLKLGWWGRELRARAAQVQTRCQARVARAVADARQAVAGVLFLGLPSY